MKVEESNVPEYQSAEVSEEILVQASALVKEFTKCFWFWAPDAEVKNREDVLLVIRHLREYGGHKAWYAAQDLWKCL